MLGNMRTQLSAVIWLTLMALAAIISPAALTAQDLDGPGFQDLDLEELRKLEEPQRGPGIIEGIGTYFEVIDSDYLDITLESTEPVNLMLESIPHMIVIHIEAAEEATSTEIKLSGFEPDMTYYKYEDSHQNSAAFTTDEDGSCSFTQDLTEPHLVFIQPQPSTRYIPTDNYIGTWDPDTRIYTLKRNVSGTIEIKEDNLTVNGNDFTVTGSSGYGIYLNKRTGVTIRNLNVQGFTYGMYLNNSGGNVLEDNSVTASSSYGIYFYYNNSTMPTGNTMRRNIMSGSQYNFVLRANMWKDWYPDFDHDIDTSNTVDGKPVYYVVRADSVVYDSSTNAGVFYAIDCNNITIKDLTLTDNYYGLFLWRTRNSRIENVNASNNNTGITIGRYSYDNTLTGNDASSNYPGTGISLSGASGNTLTNNTANSNNTGISLHISRRNTLTGNTTSNNRSRGIILHMISYYTTLTANFSSNNGEGIFISTSGANTLRNNVMSGNRSNFRVHGLYGGQAAEFRNDIDTSNTVDGKLLYYIVGAEGEVYDNSTAPDAGTFHAIECNNITIRDLILDSNCSDGVFLRRTHNSTIENVTASNNVSGIQLWYCDNNTLTGNTTSNNNYGIFFSYDSDDNTLTDNNASSNSYQGIYLSNSSSNTLTNNTANSNGTYGIYIYSSGYASHITDGVSDLNILTGNTMSGNQYNFHVAGKDSSNFDHDIDMTNTAEGKPVHYIKNVTGGIYDSAANAAVFYAIDCDNITIADQSLDNNNYYGVFFWNTNNSTIENVSASNCFEGIHLRQSTNNTLTDNTASDNEDYGIYLEDANSSTLTANTANSNGRCGIYLKDANDSVLNGNTANSNIYKYSYGGIYLLNADNSTLTDNSASNNLVGIRLQNAAGSILTNNTASSNSSSGITLYYADDSTLTGNTASNSNSGIRLTHCSRSNLICNTVNSSSDIGLVVAYSNESFLAGNTVALSGRYGILISGSSACTLTGNSITSTDNLGLYVYNNSSNNLIYNNNFRDNALQARVSGNTSTGNVFNLDAPVGGNYWSDWTGPDVNPEDGFVDEPYVFSGSQDNLPLVSPAPSICNEAPVANAGDDQNSPILFEATLNGANSYDPDEDYPLTYLWQILDKPLGSAAELSDPQSPTPTINPDLIGDYIVQLVVTDSRGLPSEPDHVVVTAISIEEALDEQLNDIIDEIGEIDPTDMHNPNSADTLLNKMEAVMQMIDEGDYAEALDKLQNDILQKTDGCAEAGQPDANDWIITCPQQDRTYPLVTRAIELVDKLIL